MFRMISLMPLLVLGPLPLLIILLLVFKSLIPPFYYRILVTFSPGSLIFSTGVGWKKMPFSSAAWQV